MLSEAASLSKQGGSISSEEFIVPPQYSQNIVNEAALPVSLVPECGFFVDREKLQLAFKDFIHHPIQKGFILQGMGGIGKTVYLAKTIRTNVGEKMIYWHSCTQNTTIEDILGELHTFLVQHEIYSLSKIWNAETIDVDIRIKGLIQCLSQKYILVFDDFQKLLNVSKTIEDTKLNKLIIALLSKTHPAKIVLSSRIRPIISDLPLGICDYQIIEGLSKNDSIHLLQRQGLMNEKRGELEILYKRVEGNPLALAVISQLWKRGYSIDKIQNLSVTEIDYKSGESLLERLLTELWPFLSFQEKSALKCLAVYRLPIPSSAFKYIYPDSIADDILLHLAECSLIRSNDSGDGFLYSIHELIREYILENISEEENRILQLSAADYWDNSELLFDEPLNFKDLQPFMERRWHLLQGGDYEKVGDITILLSRYLFIVGAYTYSLTMFFETSKILRPSKELAEIYVRISMIYNIQGKYDESRHYLQKAYDIHLDMRTTIELAQISNYIGGSYYHQKDYETALKWFEVEEVINEKANAPEWQIVLSDRYTGIGLVYTAQHKYAQGLNYLKKALEIEKNAQNSDRDLSIIYNSMGFNYMCQKLYNEATYYYGKAQVIWRALGNTVYFGMSYVNIGLLKAEQGDYIGAIELYTRAEKIFKKYEIDIELRKCYFNKGLAYIQQKKYHRALEDLVKAHQLAETLELSKDLDKSYSLLGFLYWSLGDYDMAKSCFYRLNDQISGVSISTFITLNTGKLQSFMMQFSDVLEEDEDFSLCGILNANNFAIKIFRFVLRRKLHHPRFLFAVSNNLCARF